MIAEEKIPTESDITQRRQWRSGPLPSLIFAGCLFELLYLLILALAPLPALHLASSPLAEGWSWVLIPSHWLFSTAADMNPFHSMLEVALLTTILVTFAATYAFVIDIFQGHSEYSNSQRWLWLLLIGALFFGLTLLFQPALFSNDVYTYIFSGRILAIYHVDPLNTAPVQLADDPYLRWVVVGRNVPNIYGPLWLGITSALVGISLGTNPVTTLLIFKSAALLTHLINCVLIWVILSKIALGRRVLGTLLYAWNPLALLELAGSGHNEGLLLTLLLLAVLLHVQQKGFWYEMVILILFGLAISTDLIALLIAPLYIWYTLHSEQKIDLAIRKFGWRLLLVLGTSLVVSLPFWRGSTTFLAITSALDTGHFVNSPLQTLAGPVRWLFSMVAEASHFPPIMQPTTAADVTLRASTIFIMMLIYVNLMGRVRHTAMLLHSKHFSDLDPEVRLASFEILLSSWVWVLFWYLVLVSGWFWPWYMLWVLWIVALRRIDAKTIAILLLSSTALLIYPLQALPVSVFTTYQPILIFGIPLVYLLLPITRKRRIA